MSKTKTVKSKRTAPYIPQDTPVTFYDEKTQEVLYHTVISAKEKRKEFVAMLDSAEEAKYIGKRNSFKRSFENTYLRSNILKRALTQLPKKKINRILNNPEFNSATRYIAAKMFNRYRDFLLVYGFEAEDMVNIAKIFGLNFYTSKFEAKTKKDEYYLMLRYIGQRFHGLVEWSIKKFGTAISIKAPHAEDSEDSPDLLSAFYDDAAFKEWWHGSHEEVEINGIMIEMNKPRPVTELKKDLDQNWQKHAEELAHYATTVYTSIDVRRKARVYCNKYGIDYVKWAKTKIELGKMSDHDVDLRQ